MAALLSSNMDTGKGDRHLYRCRASPRGYKKH